MESHESSICNPIQQIQVLPEHFPNVYASCRSARDRKLQRSSQLPQQGVVAKLEGHDVIRGLTKPWLLFTVYWKYSMSVHGRI